MTTMTPCARRADPEASHLAAEGITKTGARAKQQIQVAALVERHPGYTSHELAEFSGLDRYQIARRLPEIITVERRGKRQCTVSGRTASTWYPRG